MNDSLVINIKFIVRERERCAAREGRGARTTPPEREWCPAEEERGPRTKPPERGGDLKPLNSISR
jgi:hypothetical protein